MMVLKHRDKYTSYCIWELLILFCLCICIAPFFPFWVFVVITISCLLFLPQRGWKLHNDELHYAFCLFGFGATAPSGPWPSSFTRFLYHTQRRATVGRTPLDEWSVRRRDLYLTTHTTLTANKCLCPWWDSNPQSQQASGRRPTP